MKNLIKLFIIIAIVALVATVGTGAVFATENVAQSAATLAVHVPESDTRAAHLEAFLASYNSPFADEATHFVAEADRLNLDWKLVAAIAGVESTFGKQIPRGSYNAWGWGIPTGAQWGVAFRSWKEGITAVSEGLKFNYIDRGAQTIEQIGRIYAASPAWPWKVRFFLSKIEEFTPNDPELLAVTI